MAKRSTNHNKYVANDPVRKILLKNFLKQLTQTVKDIQPDTIVDAGCGEGFVLNHLHQSGVRAKMRGVDVSSEAVKVAKKQLPEADFVQGSIYELPYKDSSADLVLCNEVLEHLDDPQKALSEIMRVSKKYVICSVPHEPWFMLGSLAGGKYVSRLGNHPEHINHWTAWSFPRFLSRNGLVITKTFALKTFPWTLVVCEKEVPVTTEFLKNTVKNLKHAQHDIRNSNLNELVVSYAKGTSFFDVGCGVGNLVHLASQKGFTSSGMDLEEELVETGNELYADIQLYVESVFNIQKIPGKFDTISAIDVIEHIKDDVGALKKMVSKLNPGGRLIIVVPAHPELYGTRDKHLGHFRRYTRKELVSKMQEAGLQIKTVRSWNAIGILPYLISEKILKKPMQTQLRTSQENGSKLHAVIRHLLNTWVRTVEKSFDARAGLSLICVGETPSHHDI